MSDFTPDDIADHIETVLNAHGDLWDDEGGSELTTQLTAGNEVTVTIAGDDGEQEFRVTVEAVTEGDDGDR